MVVGSCYYYLGWCLLLLSVVATTTWAGVYYYHLVAGELISGREAAAIPSHWLTKPSPAPHTFVNRILTSRTRLSYIHRGSITHTIMFFRTQLSFMSFFYRFQLNPAAPDHSVGEPAQWTGVGVRPRRAEQAQVRLPSGLRRRVLRDGLRHPVQAPQRQLRALHVRRSGGEGLLARLGEEGCGSTRRLLHET